MRAARRICRGHCARCRRAFLAEVLLDLTGAPRVGIRMERLDRAMCPRLPVDRVVLRLVCTDQGPGTEWMEAGRCGHPTPGAPAVTQDPGARLIGDGEQLHRAEPAQVVLLKGEEWPGNAGNGAIHRSSAPGVDGRERVLLTLDPVW